MCLNKISRPPGIQNLFERTGNKRYDLNTRHNECVFIFPRDSATEYPGNTVIPKERSLERSTAVRDRYFQS